MHRGFDCHRFQLHAITGELFGTYQNGPNGGEITPMHTTSSSVDWEVPVQGNVSRRRWGTSTKLEAVFHSGMWSGASHDHLSRSSIFSTMQARLLPHVGPPMSCRFFQECLHSSFVRFQYSGAAGSRRLKLSAVQTLRYEHPELHRVSTCTA